MSASELCNNISIAGFRLQLSNEIRALNIQQKQKLVKAGYSLCRLVRNLEIGGFAFPLAAESLAIVDCGSKC